jgi:hypothetical protein
MQVVSARQTRLARPLAATMLMHNHSAQRLHVVRYPDRVVDRIDEFARTCRSLVTHAIIRRVCRRKNVIRRFLRERDGGKHAELNRNATHCGDRLLNHQLRPRRRGNGNFKWATTLPRPDCTNRVHGLCHLLGELWGRIVPRMRALDCHLRSRYLVRVARTCSVRNVVNHESKRRNSRYTFAVTALRPGTSARCTRGQ